jgi:acyl carrier protein
VITDIQKEVKRLITERLSVADDQVRPETAFIDDLGVDSLGLVELVLAFEEVFNVQIPDQATEKLRTVQDAIDYIQAHAKA